MGAAGRSSGVVHGCMRSTWNYCTVLHRTRVVVHSRVSKQVCSIVCHCVYYTVGDGWPGGRSTAATTLCERATTHPHNIVKRYACHIMCARGPWGASSPTPTCSRDAVWWVVTCCCLCSLETLQECRDEGVRHGAGVWPPIVSIHKGWQFIFYAVWYAVCQGLFVVTVGLI